VELAGGALVFLGFIILFLLAVVYSTYSKGGSGISQRPHGKLYSGAPGAGRRGTLGSDRDRLIRGSGGWSRGCR
jgi:hypothetical protein